MAQNLEVSIGSWMTRDKHVSMVRNEHLLMETLPSVMRPPSSASPSHLLEARLLVPILGVKRSCNNLRPLLLPPFVMAMIHH